MPGLGGSHHDIAHGRGAHGRESSARAAQRKVVLRGKGSEFGDQEAISGDTECGVTVEAALSEPFIIAEAGLLLVPCTLQACLWSSATGSRLRRHGSLARWPTPRC